jgi:hypothetical protein
MHARALQRQTAEIQAASQAKSSEDWAPPRLSRNQYPRNDLRILFLLWGTHKSPIGVGSRQGGVPPPVNLLKIQGDAC